MLQSPKKRRTNTSVVDLAARAPMYLSASDLHLEAWNPEKTKPIIEMVVLYKPEEVRYVFARGQQSGVYTILGGDMSAPILFETWREEAEKLHEQLQAMAAGSSSNDTCDVKIIIEIVDPTVKTDPKGGRNLCPYRKLVTNERTTFQLKQRSERKNMLVKVPLSAKLIVADFKALEVPLPFRVNISGIVDSVQEETISEKGNPVQVFNLVDASGKYVRVACIGRHSGTEAIEARNEIVIFFAQAQKAENVYENGSLVVYNEAHIVVLRKNATLAKSRLKLMLRPY